MNQDNKTRQMNGNPIELDSKDIQILKVLQHNGRLSMREVANKVNLSPSPTQERIKRLEREGVILQYAAILDPARLNKSTVALCQVTLNKHNKKAAQEFIDKIMSFDEVLECFNIAGDFDFTLKIVTESIKTYHDFFLNKLSEIPFINQTKTTFVMSVIKNTHKVI